MIKIEVSHGVWEEYPGADAWDIKDGCVIVSKNAVMSPGMAIPFAGVCYDIKEPAKTYKIYNRQEWLTVEFEA